jgi:hypothetical protein
MEQLCTRPRAVIAGLAVALVFSPAHALNGGTRVISCACQTTADFNTAARADNSLWQGNLTYSVVSTSKAETALMQVAGEWVGTKEPIWRVTAATPIDSSGNSLAGNSESANESYFAAFDQVLFGANRSAPQMVNEPADYAGSFINSLDEEVVPGISNALIQMGVNPATIAVGTLITVKFADGTTAQYIKASSTSSYQWTWTGVAHNSAGKLIHRDGSLVVNPNTAGNGSGSFGAPGFGPGAPDYFHLTDPGLCQYGGTISFDDGEELTSFSFGPC